jgi:hypothetical protein
MVVVVCTISIEIYSMISCSRQSLIKTATAEFQQHASVLQSQLLQHRYCSETRTYVLSDTSSLNAELLAAAK